MFASAARLNVKSIRERGDCTTQADATLDEEPSMLISWVLSGCFVLSTGARASSFITELLLMLDTLPMRRAEAGQLIWSDRDGRSKERAEVPGQSR